MNPFISRLFNSEYNGSMEIVAMLHCLGDNKRNVSSYVMKMQYCSTCFWPDMIEFKDEGPTGTEV